MRFFTTRILLKSLFFFNPKLKLFTIFFGCTSLFVSGLVGNILCKSMFATNTNVAEDQIKGYKMNDFHGQLCSYLQINYVVSFSVTKRSSRKFSVISGRSHHSSGITNDPKNKDGTSRWVRAPNISVRIPKLSPLGYRTPIKLFFVM